MNEVRRNESDEERSRRRRQRIEEMKRQKRRAELLQRSVIPAAALVILILAVVGICNLVRGNEREPSPETEMQDQMAKSIGRKTENLGPGNSVGADEDSDCEDGVQESGVQGDGGQEGKVRQPEEVYGPFLPEESEPPAFAAESTSVTAGFSDSVISEYGVMIDVENGTILAQKGGSSRINPASMTKILTVLTAADALGIGGEDWDSLPVLEDKFVITIEITDYSFIHGCSNVGFDVGEEVTVRDLFYGTILSSGADAALGLAYYVAGSQEAFVELMNQKLEELGLSDSTHFTNCVGLYDEDHYSTVYDIAVILKTAADNPFCRDVLSARKHLIPPTVQHEEGLLISNLFLRRIEDKDTHGEVICAKTGYVNESKNCAASLGADINGKEYICVTAGSSSNWRCIYDHVELYQTWLTGE